MTVAYCRFTGMKEYDKCEVCGYELRQDYATVPVRQCDVNHICRHQGDSMTAIKVQCGNFRTKIPTKKCEVWGRCVPNYRSAKWSDRHEAAMYHLCIDCAEYAPK